MTSLDVRDVLNLPADGQTPRPSKKQRTSAPRPNLKGLAREVQNLGGDTPIAIVPEVALYKKRRYGSRKPAAKWGLRSFRNSARQDGTLVLRHWRRQDETDASQLNREAGAEAADGADGTNGANARAQGNKELEDSAFSKYNVQVDVPQYSEHQYTEILQNDDWTKDETDYLMQLVKDYDLRWPIVWDRYGYSPPKPPAGDSDTKGNDTAMVQYPKNRSMEDLKARYYKVAAKMMEVQKPVQYMTPPEWSYHQMLNTFDPKQETKRKEFALNSLSRSKEEAREEESLLLEVRRIYARSQRYNEERRELYNRLEFPQSNEDTSVYKSSQGLTDLLNRLMSVDKSKKRKSVMSAEGVSPAGPGPNGQPASAASEAPPSRRESIAATAAGHRESIGAEKPNAAGNKKGQPQPERRKLSEREEQIYGVSTHERLGSGPTFRCEKVNKLFSHKSGQQMLRINNVLTELQIPARPAMPTASVVVEYEELVKSVTSLVDLRKLRDKHDLEIKMEEAKRAERAKARRVLGTDGASDEPPPEPKADGGSGGAASTNAGEASAKVNSQSTDQKPTEASSAGPAAQQEPDVVISNGDAASAAGVVKEEEAPKESRPGSSGNRKRSASVISDKSAKRQKKS